MVLAVLAYVRALCDSGELLRYGIMHHTHLGTSDGRRSDASLLEIAAREGGVSLGTLSGSGGSNLTL